MPCLDSQAHDRAIEAQEKQKLVERLDKVTRILCHAFNQLEAKGLNVDDFTKKEGRTWWKEHKAFDARRAKGPANKP